MANIEPAGHERAFAIAEPEADRLALYARRTSPAAALRLEEEDGTVAFRGAFAYDDFSFLDITLTPGRSYRLVVRDLSIVLAHVSGPAALDRGVTFLEFAGQEVRRYDASNLAEVYDSPLRNQYHFSPYAGWMNDPNGLIHFQGRFHVFYQAYPYAPKWASMHWGHAVSTDLVHWRHQPVALYPQPELMDNPDCSGGVFSGSAVESEGAMNLLFTSHFECGSDPDRFSETQHRVRSRDGLHFGPAEVVISGVPDERVGRAFRDPKVWRQPAGVAGRSNWKMVLGALESGIPSVLLYSSPDLATWRYDGVLYRETEVACDTIECPDFFPLDGRYVLIASLLNSEDPATGRRNLCYAYVGDLVDGRFSVEHRVELDVGTDFYALQTFEHDGRRLAVAWLDNWASTYRGEDQPFVGVLSLPRELSLEGGTLRMRPAREVSRLRAAVLADTLEQAASLRGFGDNTVELRARFSRPSDFEVRLALDEQGRQFLAIRYAAGVLAWEQAGGRTGYTASFRTELAAISDLHVYLDRSCVEVFVNDYRVSGTRRYYLPDATPSLSLRVADPASVTEVTVWKLASAW